MFYRFVAAMVILLCSTLSASALTMRNMDEPLVAAAARMKVKDFNGARESALKSGEKGSKAFLVGMADVKLELWEEAASQLAVAAENFPILADYALYNRGLALSKLARNDQALAPLYTLLKQYPDSRLIRPAMILYADTLAAASHPKEALQTYLLFIERYPSGSDSISALYGSALCRAKLGDPQAGAEVLRGIWLKYPGSAIAGKADLELKNLASAGTTVAPYTPAELFKRGSTLYDLGRYRDAIQALSSVPLAGQSEEFVSRLQLKTGEAQFKVRRYQDAQSTLSPIMQKGGSNAAEAAFWYAKSIDKAGRSDDAYDLYLRLADGKGSSVADDALLEAAYLKRYQKKWGEAQQLFKRYLSSYPGQNSATALWEAAWASYQFRDYPGAATLFRKLSGQDEMREKALYWLAKSLTAAGDAKGAEAATAALATEYPFGYYALLCNRWCDVSSFPTPPKSLTEALPMPAGFEREKALISLGLYDEAGRELRAKKPKNTLAIARLYLEMGSYNGAYHTVAEKRIDTASVWGINYPLAYRDEVSKYAAANGIPESLVYAVMRTESNYLPSALSPVGAVGLMQIMPATAERISQGGSSKLTSPELNIRLGAKHLKGLLSHFDRNLTLVIAAYNAGSGNVGKWQKSLGNLPQDEWVESIPFHETREYVKKVRTAMELYQRLYRLPAYKN